MPDLRASRDGRRGSRNVTGARDPGALRSTRPRSAPHVSSRRRASRASRTIAAAIASPRRAMRPADAALARGRQREERPGRAAEREACAARRTQRKAAPAAPSDSVSVACTSRTAGSVRAALESLSLIACFQDRRSRCASGGQLALADIAPAQKKTSALQLRQMPSGLWRVPELPRQAESRRSGMPP